MTSYNIENEVPKRILQFNNSLGKSSGVMSVVMNYYRNINIKKIQFDFLFYSERKESHEDEIIKKGGRIFKINTPSLNKKNNNEILQKLIVLRKNGYDTLHIHSPYDGVIVAFLAKKAGFINIIAHSHSSSYSDHFVGKIRNWTIHKFLFKKRFTHYMACSKAAGKFLFPNSKYYLLNNAINVEENKFNLKNRDRIRKIFGIKQDEIILIHIGLFSKGKNQSFLVDIMSELSKIKPSSYKLFLIGEGPLKNDVEKKVKKLKLDNSVFFLGYRKDVSNLLSSADIFLLPSLYEGLPMVGVEAQASGLPCIFSDKVTREIGDNDSKFLSIKSSKVWEKEIINTKLNNDREHCYISLINRNLSIREEVQKLENYYLALNGEKS